MPNPDGTYTKDEHQRAIIGLYLKNREAGMSEDEAMVAARHEWRAALQAMQGWPYASAERGTE